LAFIFYLRQTDAAGSSHTYLYLEVGGTLLSFCYAANALVRFRGTHDRTALILAFGFVLSGIIETVGYFGLNDTLAMGPAALSSIPMGWMVSRTLLAVLILAALAVDRFMPTARQPSKETAAALLVVALATYLTSAAFFAAPAAPIAHVARILSRPWDLLPAALFMVAAVCFRLRLKEDREKKSEATLFDYSLFIVASLNVICHVAAAFSRQLFDGPFFLAELSKTSSYVVVLSGALLEHARLFEQVRSMAVSDPLTGLANYRRLIGVIEAELDRSRRTQRPFSIVLLDMDGLKTINDQYGHLTGSRALVRIGKILRNHSRAIDTAARYGGDEFAVVLPEAGPDIASRVVSRIRERLSTEPEHPEPAEETRQKRQTLFPSRLEAGDVAVGPVNRLLLVKARELHGKARSWVNGVGQGFVEKASLQDAKGSEVVFQQNVIVVGFGGLQCRVPKDHQGRRGVWINLLRRHNV